MSNLYLASISDLLDFSNVFLVMTKPVFGVFDHVQEKPDCTTNDTRRKELSPLSDSGGIEQGAYHAFDLPLLSSFGSKVSL